MSPKVAQIAQMTQDGPKRPNGPGCPKTVQGGPNFIDYTKMHKWQKKSPKRQNQAQMDQIAKSDQNGQKWPRVAKTDPNSTSWSKVS